MTDESDEIWKALLEGVKRLTRDMRHAAAIMTDREARFAVDTYYAIQKFRQRSENQIRAVEKSLDPQTQKEPHTFTDWMLIQSKTYENSLRRGLGYFALAQPVGGWLSGIVGIGPVLAAGLIAHIDIRKAPTVGHIWRFAGLDPTQQWLGQDKARELYDQLDGTPLERLSQAARIIGRNSESLERDATTDFRTGEVKDPTKARCIAAMARIPYNRQLKTLCWKVGDSFVKVSNRPGAFYGRIYRDRKALEMERNGVGVFADQAEHKLATFNIGKSTEAYKHYSAGKLPPAHIDMRARRYAVKLFLSHLHDRWYRLEYGTPPPKPYPIAHLDHAHYVDPPGQAA